MCPWPFKAAGDGQEEGLASIERPRRSQRPLSRPYFLRDHVAPPSEFSVPPGNYFPEKVTRREAFLLLRQGVFGLRTALECKSELEHFNLFPAALSEAEFISFSCAFD